MKFVYFILIDLCCQELHMSAVQLAYDPQVLPASWEGDPALVAPVVDQGWCDNSWAVAALTVAADRQASSSHCKYSVILHVIISHQSHQSLVINHHICHNVIYM